MPFVPLDNAPFPTGWIDDPVAVQAVQAGLRFPTFGDTPTWGVLQHVTLPAEVFLWKAYEKIKGQKTPCRNQGQVGSCVSFGTANAVERTMAVEIVAGDPEEFRDLAQEVIYGGSRVEVGGGRLRGDGSVGAWAADFVRKWGVVARGTYGSHDLSSYDESRCRQYGDRGVPDDLEPEARLHPCTDVSQVSTWEQAKVALAAGYGIAVCSQQGFSMQRDGNGICRPSGSWAHCYPAGAMVAGLQFRPIQDVQIGDRIYDRAGDLRTVIEVYCRPFRGNLCRIKAGGATATTMTEDHPVMVYRRVPVGFAMAQTVGHVNGGPSGAEWVRNDRPRYSSCWVKASAVRPGDYLATPVIEQCDEPHAPQWVNDRPMAKPLPSMTPSRELAWLFGFLIGDASFVKGHKVQLRIARTKPWRRVIEALRSLGVKVSLKRYPTFVEIRAYSAILADSCRTWFLGKNGRQIPHWLTTWDLQSLIDGLTDADGCRFKTATRITTISPVLAQQLRMILGGLGYRPTWRAKQPGKGAYVNGKEQHEIEWRSVASRGVVQRHDGLLLCKVLSVMLLPFEGDVFNLEVEETHSYVADGFATHNCMCLDGYCVIEGKEYGHIDNSWGANAHTGPVGPGEPSPSGFWADAGTVGRMLGQDDSWAFAGLKGWRTTLPLWLF